MSRICATAEEAKRDAAGLDALTELVYQLADDDLLAGHRASEWIGLGPHLEEDVAFASIAQDTMGHAVMFYRLLEALGAGRDDDVAQLRKPEQFRNAVLVERPNGRGHYRQTPDFDWAYAVMRNYAYTAFKSARLASLERSSFLPLAESAAKIGKELFYHLYHWETWIDQLAGSTEEARRRMNAAVGDVWADIASLFDLGPQAEAIVRCGLAADAEQVRQQFMARVRPKLAQAGLIRPGEPQPLPATGREGRHSAELAAALAELGEVYRLDPQASW